MSASSDRSRFLLVVLAAVVVNLASLAPGFIHDDHPIVETNPLIEDPSRAGEILTRGYWSSADVAVGNLYRPVTLLSLLVNRALLGDGALGYRAVNLALHALAAALVFALARRVLPRGAASGRLDPATLAALLFAVHPVHTEVLGEIVGRGELLAAAGTLASVLLFLRGRDAEGGSRGSGPRGWYTLAIAGLALAFLSKENAIAAPALVLLADLLVGRRAVRVWFHAAAAAALALCLLLRAAVLGGIVPGGGVHYLDNPIAHLPFLEGRLTALRVIASYAALLVAPFRLAIDRSYDAVALAAGPLEPAVLAGSALVAGGAALLVRWWRRAPDASLAIGWMGIALAPTANLVVPIGTIMAERLLYLPSVGFCLLAGAGWARLRAVAPGGARGRALTILAALLLVGFAGRSAWRLRDWRDDYTVFRRSIEVAPRSVRGLYNYAVAAETRGDDAEALRAYGEAISIYPPFADAHYNLAGVHARRREWERSLEHYHAALRERPNDVQSLVNLGRCLNALGRHGEALEAAQRAIGIDPASDRALTVLGAARLALGDPAAAVRAYREAARLRPGDSEYLMNLGMAHERAGEWGESAAAYAGAVEASPGQPVLRYHLGRALERADRLEEAAAAYRGAIRIAPDSPVPLRNLGALLYRMGDREGARAALEGCAALDRSGAVMDGESRRLLDLLRQPAGRRR